MAKSPQEIMFGDPVSATHEPVPSEMQEWMEETELNAGTVAADLRNRVITMAHRCAMDLAPENTLAGISAAYYAGYDGVEVDVSFTSDDVPILMHDSTVDRTTSQTGNVVDLDLATIQGAAYEVGSFYAPRFEGCRVPTLEDALDWMMGRFSRIHIELKSTMTEPQMTTILDLVTERHLEDVVIFISYTDSYLAYMRSQNADVGIGYIDATASDFSALTALGGRIYCSFTDAEMTSDPTIVRDAQALGIEVFGKTTNIHEEAVLYLQKGIRVIQSDIGIFTKPRTPTGNVISIPRDLSGMVLDVNTAGSSITSDADTGIINIDSKLTGGIDAIEVPMKLAGGDYVYAEAYVRRISGDAPRMYLDSGSFSQDNLLYETGVAGETFKIGGYLYMGGSADGIRNQPLRIGYGSLAAGEAEIFDVKIITSSRAYNGHDGSFQALVLLETTGPTIRDNWAARGVAGAFYETGTTYDNIVCIKVEGSDRESMFPSVEIVSNDVSGVVATAQFVDYQGEGVKDPDYAVVRVAIFEPDGTPFDLTANDAESLRIKG